MRIVGRVRIGGRERLVSRVRLARRVRRRGSGFEHLGNSRREGRLRRRFRAPVAELFAFDSLLVLETVLVSASRHTVLLMM